MNHGNNNDSKPSGSEQVDPITLIDEKYSLAIANRTKAITEELKSIVKKLESEENDLRSLRKSEIDKLKSKFESIKTGAPKPSGKLKIENPPDGAKIVEELKNMEEMDLGALFNDQVDYEEAVVEIKEQAQPSESVNKVT